MRPLLAVNAGSSSLKAALFDGANRRDYRYARIGRDGPPDHRAALHALLEALPDPRPAAVVHRITHGGDCAAPVRRLDEAERGRLQDLCRLAPLHQPSNLLGVALCEELLGPDVPQWACYDTAFHHNLPAHARRLPVPGAYPRYGFHGINYAHIARRLPALLGATAEGRIAVAHLGSGASLCLLEGLRSSHTTMAYTPLGGIPMSTRSGDLDPGVVLALVEEAGLEAARETLYRGSGLQALSGGLSGDMQTLLESTAPEARFAVEYFCRGVAAGLAGLAAHAGGLDGLVFTGGIGEHAAPVRAQVVARLGFLGFALDDARNGAHAERLDAADSHPVLVVPADEEAMMAAYLAAAGGPREAR
ncbi:acetate kinase [Ectothiorhodospiraceae bacterium 2226]|nr:acetate kinase [Ectothiorhodospiraceae bacterium 2226]